MKESPRNRALREEAKECERILAQDVAAAEQASVAAARKDREARSDPQVLVHNSTITGNLVLIELSRLATVARADFEKLRSAQADARRRLQEIRAELSCDTDATEAMAALTALPEKQAARATDAKRMAQLCDDLAAEITGLTEDRKRALEARAAEELKARLEGGRAPADTMIAELDRKLETARATQATANSMSQVAAAAVTELGKTIREAELRLGRAQHQQALRDWRAAEEAALPAAARLLAAQNAIGSRYSDGVEIRPSAEMIAAASTALRAKALPMKAVDSPTAPAAAA